MPRATSTVDWLGPLRWVVRVLHGFADLSWHERYLLMVAAPTVVVVRLALYATPTHWLLKRVLGRPVRPMARGVAAEPLLVGRAVRRAARVVPRATCLTQALATRWLLSGRGHMGDLRIGVKRGEGGTLLAHAWVEHGDQIVIGHRGVPEYTVMPGLDGAL